MGKKKKAKAAGTCDLKSHLKISSVIHPGYLTKNAHK